MMRATFFTFQERERHGQWHDTADDLFQQGLDTADIARRRFAREADVLRELTVQRCERLRLPNPYPRDRL